MTKSFLIVLIALLFCAHSLTNTTSRDPTYKPSTPGGTYTNNITPNGTSPNYPNNYNQSSGSTNTNGVYVNGVLYQYTGPFTLVCY